MPVTRIDIETLRKAWKAVDMVRPFFRQHRVRILSGFLSLAGVNLLQLTIPRIIRRAVDGLEQGAVTQSELFLYGVFILLLALVIAVCRFGWRYFILGFSRILEKDLRTGMFSHLLTLDRAFFQKKPVGEIMALASNDLASVQLASGMGLIAFADALFMTAATLCFMAYIHPGLTLLAIIPMPLLAFLTTVLSARLHQRFRKVQEQFSHLTEFVRSTLSGIRLVKVYTQEWERIERFGRLGDIYVRNNLKLAMVQGALFPVAGLAANASLLLVLFFGGRLAIGGVITIGDFVAFVSYLFMLTWPTMALGWVANLFQRGITSLSRIRAVLDVRPELTDPENSEPLPAICSGFSFRNLTFRYGPHLEPSLRNFSLDIGPGILGVVGRTGSGKSTLCHILARLYPVPDNSLFVEGHDVNRLPIAALRNSISYVPQEVLVFSDTISANIAFGRPDALPGEIEGVARAAAIHEEILAMGKGYETRIGEKGVTLSGGQRQRVALARALLLARPVLIIDDGLSAVDAQTEHEIISNLRPYLAGKICVIVSHRLAPLAHADRIVVLEEGQVAEEGTHEELLSRGGLYSAIYTHQSLEEERL